MFSCSLSLYTHQFAWKLHSDTGLHMRARAKLMFLGGRGGSLTFHSVAWDSFGRGIYTPDS